ncbi:MAG TPA: extensin family protein [Aestuariivirgaceae bacterium]|nr:extensin family protein [Aestuariivirgaceae bacterium]
MSGLTTRGLPMLFRSLLMLALLVLAPAVSAQSVPLPMEKPAVASEEEIADGEEVVADEVAPVSDACRRTLEAAGVVAEVAAPFNGDAQCILEDPVALAAVGAHTGNVGLPGRPTLECRFAAVFGDWLREVVNPVAASLLGSHVDAVVTGPGHQCRSRAGGKISEHGIGNAIDITAIRLIDGRSIRIEGMADAKGPEREFLRAISASACGYFTTVLGPWSDAAHADHLHLDMAERRSAEYRICMAR